MSNSPGEPHSFDSSFDKLESLSPGERRTFDIPLSPVTSRSVVTWQFSCESYDVSVSTQLFRSSNLDKPTLVLPPLRLKAISGSFILDTSSSSSSSESTASDAKERATATLRFTVDNSFSLLRGKNVKVSARILKSTAELEKKASRLIDHENVDEVNIAANEGQTLFMTNNFHLAEEMFSREKDRVPIFALCFATVAWLRAMMTMSADDVKTARSKLSTAELVAESCMTSCISRDAKLEAEIVLAELQLLQGVLSLLEESVLGLVNCALSVRSAFLKYARVNKEAFNGRIGVISSSSTDDDEYDTELEEVNVVDISTAKLPLPELSHVLSGLQFGLGTFNLVSSVLPPFILRLLSIAGFPANRRIGFSCLRACLKGGGVRFPLASMNLLGMRVIFPSFHSGADIPTFAREGRRIIDGTLHQLNDSALFLWFKGRLERMQLLHCESHQSFNKCAMVTRDRGLPQLAQLADYEEVFLSLFTGDFETMLKIAKTLERDNSWSVTTYAFLQGVALLEMGRAVEARAMFSHLLNLSLKRLAGRIVAAEQWAVKRAAEFVAQTTTISEEVVENEGFFRILVKNTDDSFARDFYPSALLGVETIYFWGGFQQMTIVRLEAAVQRSDKVLKNLAKGRFFDAEHVQDSEISNDTNQSITDLLTTAANALVPYGIDQKGGDGNATMIGTLLSSFSFMGSSATSGPSGELVAGTSSFASVSQVQPVHITAVCALLRGASLISLGNIDSAHETLDWIVSNNNSSRLWSREAHIVAYSMYELGTLYLVLSRYTTLLSSSMLPESNQNRNIAASRLSKTTSAVMSKTLARKYFKMASSISVDFPWKVRLAIRIHLAIGELDEMA